MSEDAGSELDALREQVVDLMREHDRLRQEKIQADYLVQNAIEDRDRIREMYLMEQGKSAALLDIVHSLIDKATCCDD